MERCSHPIFEEHAGSRFRSQLEFILPGKVVTVISLGGLRGRQSGQDKFLRLHPARLTELSTYNRMGQEI